MSRLNERARALSHTPTNLQPPSIPGQQSGTRRKSSHAEHREFHLRTRRIHCLKAHGHDPMKVVKDAAASFHNTDWTEEQMQALKEWHSWYHAWYDRDAKKTPDENQMVHAITLLGRIFFLDSLDENTIRFSWNTSFLQKHNKLGSTRKLNDLQVRISMDPADYHRIVRVRDHRSALIGTLLHECCHAFLRLYGCRGECGDIDCRVGKYSSIGDSGHAGAWLYLAAHVEIAAREHLQWTDVRLGIFPSLILESDASTYAPTRKDWEALLENLSDEGWDLLSYATYTEWAGLEKMYRRHEALVVNLKQEWERLRRERMGRDSKPLGVSGRGDALKDVGTGAERRGVRLEYDAALRQGESRVTNGIGEWWPNLRDLGIAGISIAAFALFLNGLMGMIHFP